jgi:hypothetical protein
MPVPLWLYSRDRTDRQPKIHRAKLSQRVTRCHRAAPVANKARGRSNIIAFEIERHLLSGSTARPHIRSLNAGVERRRCGRRAPDLQAATNP